MFINFTTMLPDYQIKANEEFFNQTIRFLKEGGVWGWIAEQEVFTMYNGVLHGTDVALKKVSKIVSQQYFETHFAKQ